MAIVARCPNPTCGQTLQVPDQYAGMQGKCPTCGTMVTFQPAQAAAASAPAAPPPAYAPPGGAYTAQAPAAPGAYMPPPMAGQMPAPPAGPSMSTPELVQLICVPSGLFFLVLLLIACLVPWAVGGALSGSTVVVRNMNGIALGEAGIFLILCLLVTAMVGLTYLFRQAVPLAATIAGGFGTFAFFFFLAEIVRFGSHAKAGIIIGLIAAIFAAGAFITLAVFRPLESPALQSLSMPLLRRHGGLALAAACGVFLGLFYLILTALSGPVAG